MSDNSQQRESFMICLAETSRETVERIDAFFLGYLFAYLEIDIIRDDFSVVDFQKSVARLNINTRYKHHFSYKFYHSVVADPCHDGFVKTERGDLDERSLLEWAKQIEINSINTPKLTKQIEVLKVKNFTRHDQFKKLEHNLQQKVTDYLFASANSFPLRTEEPTGIVYLVGCDRSKTIKIGYTTDIHRRLKELQKQYHFPLRILENREGTMTAEKRLLNRFKHLKVKGEWFDWDDSIIKAFKR